MMTIQKADVNRALPEMITIIGEGSLSRVDHIVINSIMLILS